MFRGFLPDGAIKAIEGLSVYFRKSLGRKAVIMLARRFNRDDALYKTRECCSRKEGWCCDLNSRIEYCGGRHPVNV